MQIFKRNSHFALPFIFLFLSHLSLAAEICDISPGTRAKKLVFACKPGNSKLPIDSDSTTDLETEQTIHLNLSESLFNTSRSVSILDFNTRNEIMTIEIEVQEAEPKKKVSFTSLSDAYHWVFAGSTGEDVNELNISVDGALLVQNPITVKELLDISSEELYLTKSFSVLNGKFKFKFKDSFFAQFNSPFQNRSENQYSVLETLGTVRNPTKRRVNLQSIANKTSAEIPLEDFLQAYALAYEKELVDDYPTYATKMTKKDKKNYITSYVVPRLSDNKKKGVMGEFIFNSYITRTHPRFVFKDAKVGVNSFDAIHVRELEKNGHREVREIFISEVKYSVDGNPPLGTVDIDGKDWRQLSNPYVDYTLQRMIKHSEEKKELAKLVQDHAEKVKLKFAVFNSKELTLTLYDVGNMRESQFN